MIHNVINTDQTKREHNDKNKRLIKDFRTKPFEELKVCSNKTLNHFIVF